MKIILRLMKIVVFVVCVIMIIWGQKAVGYKNLLMMLVALTGLLTLLYFYNKKYQ